MLLLGNNALAGWVDVQTLGALPALADVRLSGNPVLRSAPGGGRYEVQSPKRVLRFANPSIPYIVVPSDYLATSVTHVPASAACCA